MPERRGIGFVQPGSGSQTARTSVENAFIVPLFVPGECAIQAGDTAKLRFTVTNNRTAETERLLFITTGAADAVRIAPDTGLNIPPKSSITSGQPLQHNGTRSTSLDVTVAGLHG
jgi:hypothetical protein